MAHAQIVAVATKAVVSSGAVIPSIPSAAKVFARSPFDGLRGETESVISIPRNETNTTLAQILDAWVKFEICYNRTLIKEGTYISEVYSAAQDAISDIHCSSNDLGAFLLLLPGLPRMNDFEVSPGVFMEVDDFALKAAVFISALINNGSEDTYVLDVRHIYIRSGIGLQYLCHANTKNVLIHGNVGWGLGDNMESGTVIVKGSARGGVGGGLKGGKIIIEQNAGESIGRGMYGGEIHIHGYCADIWISSGPKGGKILVGGVQKYPRLEVV